jgi:pSer/pThr/pTyr-binding forkhead associated (FHA) protein
MAELKLYNKGTMVRSLTLRDRKHLIGRGEDCDLLLDGASASRKHFMIHKTDDGWELRDLGSENGTYVDGKREYQCLLGQRAMIQVADELILFEPGGGSALDDSAQTLPRWAIEEITTNPSFAEAAERDVTAHIPPAAQRRALAQDRGRLRPHLVLSHRGGERVVALDTQLTTIGFGSAKVSLGAGKEEILALVERTRSTSFVLRAKGLLGKVEVNGKQVGKHHLEPGDQFVVGGHKFRFETGLKH